MKLPKELQQKYKSKKKISGKGYFKNPNYSQKSEYILIFNPDPFNPIRSFYGKFKEFNIEDEIKVQSEIIEFLKKANIKTGSYNSNESKNLCRLIYDFLYKKLAKELEEYNESVLIYSIKQFELNAAERINNYVELSKKLNESFNRGEIQNLVKNRENISNTSVAINFLLMKILQNGISGTDNITTNQWSYLFTLSSILVVVSVIYDNIINDIVNFKIIIKEDYSFSFEKSSPFDLNKFEKVSVKKRTDYYSNLLDMWENREKEFIKKKRISIFETELSEINLAFKRQLNFYFENLLEVLFKLGTMTYGNYKYINIEHLKKKKIFPLRRETEKHLISVFKQELHKKIERKQILSLLDFISLDFSTYPPNEMLIPSKIIKNFKRLATSPLIKFDNQFLIGNEICLASFCFWVNEIRSGVFPLKLDKDSPIYTALKNFHSKKDDELEDLIENIAIKQFKKDYVIKHLKNFQRLSKIFPKFPKCGEIDLLVVNKEKKIVLVIDAKNLAYSNIPGNINNQIKKFFEKEKSYFKKLSEKEDFIKDNLEIVLDYFKIVNKDGWIVKKAFVIKDPLICAFKIDETVEFLLVDDLLNYFKKM